MCTVRKGEEELRLAKIRELKAWWKARGTYSFSYRPGKADRGLKSWLWIVAHIPRKIGRWKGFLDQPADGSFGVLG
jgi:hypothetical protein